MTVWYRRSRAVDYRCVCVCVCVCVRVCGKTADQTGRAGPRRLRLELLLDWLSGAEPPFRGVSGGARRVIRDFC